MKTKSAFIVASIFICLLGSNSLYALETQSRVEGPAEKSLIDLALLAKHKEGREKQDDDGEDQVDGQCKHAVYPQVMCGYRAISYMP